MLSLFLHSLKLPIAEFYIFDVIFPLSLIYQGHNYLDIAPIEGMMIESLEQIQEKNVSSSKSSENDLCRCVERQAVMNGGEHRDNYAAHDDLYRCVSTLIETNSTSFSSQV